MDEEKQEPQKPELCTIRIMFPVQSDEQALDCKRKIADVLSAMSQVRFDFNISSGSR